MPVTSVGGLWISNRATGNCIKGGDASHKSSATHATRERERDLKMSRQVNPNSFACALCLKPGHASRAAARRKENAAVPNNRIEKKPKALEKPEETDPRRWGLSCLPLRRGFWGLQVFFFGSGFSLPKDRVVINVNSSLRGSGRGGERLCLQVIQGHRAEVQPPGSVSPTLKARPNPPP